MAHDKVLYPGPGCLVEYMQGNQVLLGMVTEEQKGRLRIYSQNKRELSLPASRLLPWSGPFKGLGLSRSAMESFLDAHRALRDDLLTSIDVNELWDCVQGELSRASAGQLAALLWGEQWSVDQEAALGRQLLEHRSHFRFAPPDFDIFTAAVAAQRQADADAQRLRETLVGQGADFFRQLWDFSSGKSRTLPEDVALEDGLAEKLRELLRQKVSNPEGTEDEGLWKALVKGLPEHPHLALCLALAWGLFPAHYNYFLDRIGFERGDGWAAAYAQEIAAMAAGLDARLALLEEVSAGDGSPRVFRSIDPVSTIDRDDAFAVERTAEGGFILDVAFACPAVFWPFGSAFDRAVARRGSSLYLPEGDEHMLPAQAGWRMFGLDEGSQRPVLLLQAVFDAGGSLLHADLALKKLSKVCNVTLQAAENFFTLCSAFPDSGADETEKNHDYYALFANDFFSRPDSAHTAESVSASSFLSPVEQAFPLETVGALPSGFEESADKPSGPGCPEPYRLLWELAHLLRRNRIANGAVITEQPMIDVLLSGSGDDALVRFSDEPQTPLSHFVLGEMMICANSLAAVWAIERGVSLFYRAQDVGLPKEYAGVWTAPHEIAKIVRALPPASLGITPKRHAGLGVQAYAPISAPIRRYVDLFNQGQLVSYLLEGQARYQEEDLRGLLPFVSAVHDASAQVQRQRPRYWKLVYFAQQGDKQWWDGLVVEDAPLHVTVLLPLAQLFVRGKRHLFNEKIVPGQKVGVRIGKVNPLLNEIQVVEAREADDL